MITIAEIKTLFRAIFAIFPDWKVDENTPLVWQKLLGGYTFYELECAVSAYLAEALKPPTPRQVKDLVPIRPSRSFCVPEAVTAAYHRSQNTRGLILCSDNRGGENFTSWQKRRDCVITDEYWIANEVFPRGTPKIEFVMNHFGGTWVTEALREVLGISHPSEMFAPGKQSLIFKYHEFLDELVLLVQTPAQKTCAESGP